MIPWARLSVVSAALGTLACTPPVLQIGGDGPDGGTSSQGNADVGAWPASPLGGTPVQGTCGKDGAVLELPFQISGTSYSRALDRLLLTEAGRAVLHVYDPGECRDSAIALAYPGRSISVGPAGVLAAVGHDHHVSVVDLGMMAVVRQWEVPVVVTEIVLDANEDVYLFERVPSRPGSSPSSPTNVYRLDTKTGASAVAAVMSDNNAHLRSGPRGQSLFVVTAENSSADGMAHYSLLTGMPVFTKETGRLEHTPVCGDVFASDSRNLVTTACGYVLGVEDSPGSDLTQQGQLLGAGRIQHADWADTRSVLVSVLAGQEIVQVHDTSDYHLRRSINLPTLQKGAATLRLMPSRVFLNSLGTTCHVTALAWSGGSASDPSMTNVVVTLNLQ